MVVACTLLLTVLKNFIFIILTKKSMTYATTYAMISLASPTMLMLLCLCIAILLRALMLMSYARAIFEKSLTLMFYAA